MSVVACRVYDDRIEIAADSISVRGWSQLKGDNLRYAKLTKVNGMIVGGVGKTEENALMQIFCETHKPKAPTCDDLVTFLSEFSQWKRGRTNDGAITNDFFFVVEAKVFVTSNFLVQEVVTYNAIGAGDDFAMSALYLGHSPAKAVETACELSIYCERPIVQFTVPI